ncbi:unnamed protein product [Auanema sp. JU1783]|nr:unnamed protein product [Auanema sp. JU1783]
MVSKTLSVLLLLALTCQATAQCDVDRFVSCQNVFAQSLGIDDSYNWLDPEGLSLQVENIFANGRSNHQSEKGIIGVCNSYDDFLNCMMKNAISSEECFDPLFLINHDNKPKEAYRYAFLMNMLRFQCGAGFFPAVDNWTCLQKIYKGKSGALDSCTTKFYQNIAFDSDNACQYVQDGMECYKNVVSGCGLTAKYYACESFKEFTKPKYNYCSAICRLQ